ncbi:hypothetical protein MHLP_03140 [Candidatus Mycoplasma haematolamae str. Purdue]|uniref:Uncharacterized protein n=1 Tax=Mycoplasma haematolamae (strain Purdue) TaxID=1212765 RepID=I7BK11_MYCHA|nr:hypothetical protein [Candidatus Mycoplasma haematolamae]AFO52208.1 hypothetical protein MHLP_03140 [Candidatus Mycoplasma haematolamae str. Purdue]
MIFPVKIITCCCCTGSVVAGGTYFSVPLLANSFQKASSEEKSISQPVSRPERSLSLDTHVEESPRKEQLATPEPNKVDPEFLTTLGSPTEPPPLPVLVTQNTGDPKSVLVEPESRPDPLPKTQTEEQKPDSDSVITESSEASQASPVSQPDAIVSSESPSKDTKTQNVVDPEEPKLPVSELSVEPAPASGQEPTVSVTEASDMTSTTTAQESQEQLPAQSTSSSESGESSQLDAGTEEPEEEDDDEELDEDSEATTQRGSSPKGKRKKARVIRKKKVVCRQKCREQKARQTQASKRRRS